MADIEKKINLKVESNVSNINKSFNALSKHLGEMAKNVKKFTNMLNGETFNRLSNSIKSAITPLKAFGRELNKMSASVAQMEQLAKALNKIANNTRKINRVKQEQDVRAKIDIANRDKINNFNAEISKYERKTASLQNFVNVRNAFRSGSLLNIGETLASNFGSGLIGLQSRGNLSRIQSERASKEAMIEAMKGDPTKREEVAKLKGSLKGLESEEKAETAKMKYKAAVMNAVLSGVTASLKFFGDAIKTTTGVTLSLKENLNDVLGTVGGIMNLRSGAATYSIGTSLISNASAREMSLKYGLGAGQTYALQQTMTALGMQPGSDEDLMYMNAAQREKFSIFMDKYSSWYDEMRSSGVLDNIQEMQLDLYMFKQELAMDFMNWFAEHKDTLLRAIKGIANFVMKLVEGVLWIVEGIATLLSWIGIKSNNNISASMSASSGYSDAGNSYNSNSRINNVNINMTNNATGVLSNQAAMQQFYQEQMANMSKQLVAEIE